MESAGVSMQLAQTLLAFAFIPLLQILARQNRRASRAVEGILMPSVNTQQLIGHCLM